MNSETLDELRLWFNDIGDGYELVFDREGEFCWAHLVSKANPDFSVERYGRGEDELEAARSAKARWEVEQIGSPNEGRPRNLP